MSECERNGCWLQRRSVPREALHAAQAALLAVRSSPVEVRAAVLALANAVICEFTCPYPFLPSFPSDETDQHICMGCNPGPDRG